MDGKKPLLDLEALRLDAFQVGEPTLPPKKKRPRYRGRFLKGPIPVAWLSKALSLSGGYPVGVGLALWHLSAMKHNERTVHLSNVELARWGISRQSKWRVLAALEAAGLVTVQRRAKASPLVTIIVDPVDEMDGRPVDG